MSVMQESIATEMRVDSDDGQASEAFVQQLVGRGDYRRPRRDVAEGPGRQTTTMGAQMMPGAPR